MRRVRPARRPEGLIELEREGRARALSRRAVALAGLAPAVLLSLAALLAVLRRLALALPGAAVGGALGSAAWWRGRRAARREARVLPGPGAA